MGCACAAIYLRQPALFSDPRFWAEEGTFAFRHALQNPWYHVLLVAPPQGHYELLQRVAALAAARLVPLEHAPLVTTLASLLNQLVPIAIILWSRSSLLGNWLRRLAAVLITLFCLSSGEIWLNTTNSQFYLLLSTCLILADDSPGARARNWLYSIVLGIAGMSGFLSDLLLPLFAAKAVKLKTPESRREACILFLTCCFQLAVLGSVWDRLPSWGDRLARLTPLVLGPVAFSRTILLPLGGGGVAQRFAAYMLTLSSADPHLFAAIGLLILAALVLILALLLRSVGHWPTWLLGGAYALVLIFTTATALTHGYKQALIQPDFSPRYFFVPSVLLLLLALSATGRGAGRMARPRAILCATIIVISIATGLVYYRPSLRFSRDWPSWKEEVARHRQDPTYTELLIWPPGWKLPLAEQQSGTHPALLSPRMNQQTILDKELDYHYHDHGKTRPQGASRSRTGLLEAVALYQ